MENASKALIMAGAILIAIVLIALGLKIVNSNKGVTEQVGELSMSMEVAMFNSQFDSYTKNLQSASEVKTLINKITTNNYNNPDRFIVLTYQYATDRNIVIDNESDYFEHAAGLLRSISDNLKTNMNNKFRVTTTVSVDSFNYGRITQIKIELI